jgi:hypothetical protein
VLASTVGSDFTSNTTVVSTNFSSLSGTPLYGTGSVVTVGGGSRYLTSPSFSLGTSDFCIEMWVHHNRTSGYVNLFDARNGVGNNGDKFTIESGTNSSIYVYTNTNILNVDPEWIVDDWNHFALTRVLGYLRIFVNGDLKGISVTTLGGVTSTYGLIGADNYSSTISINSPDWRVSLFRMTIGNSRYTSNFTPSPSPSASFSSIDFTKDSAPYWELDTFEDWGIEFESGTTTKVTNRTGVDATARIRITAPTASASSSASTINLTAGVIWDNHDSSRTEHDVALSVAADATLALTHDADTEELRSVYIEKKVEVPGVLSSDVELLVCNSFTDLSSYSQQGTGTGTPVIDTVNTKFGVSSLSFDGNSYRSYSGISDIGTGDFTIECWIKPTTVNSAANIWQLSSASGGVTTSYSGTLGLAYYNATTFEWYHALGAGYGTFTGSLGVDGQWVHTAMVRHSGVVTIYIDGVSLESHGDTSNYSGLTDIGIGAGYSLPTYGFDGNIEDFRITVGTAKYTEGFTPPTTSLINSIPVASSYWHLETYNDWGVQFTDSTTTTLVNNTGADATIRARLTKPTAIATTSSSGGATTLAELTDSTTATTDPLITSNLSVGHFWINSTSGEAYVCTDATTDDNVWTNIGGGSGDIKSVMVATGGIETTYSADGVNYKSHTFLSSENFTTDGVGLVDILVVAGGGAGGGGNQWSGGGGGAGGMIVSSGVSLTSGTLPVVIGAGGSSAGNGENTTFNDLISIGGGGGGLSTIGDTGGTNPLRHGKDGGSGGGGSEFWPAYPEVETTGGTGVAGQGHAGGGSGSQYASGGGGGAGTVGGGAFSTNDGPGGDGGEGLINIFRDGTETYYAGGGAGNGYITGATGGDGGGGTPSNNTGNVVGAVNSGGGGSGGQGAGGNGGSGIVIVRYAI